MPFSVDWSVPPLLLGNSDTAIVRFSGCEICLPVMLYGITTQYLTLLSINNAKMVVYFGSLSFAIHHHQPPSSTTISHPNGLGPSCYWLYGFVEKWCTPKTRGFSINNGYYWRVSSRYHHLWTTPYSGWSPVPSPFTLMLQAVRHVGQERLGVTPAGWNQYTNTDTQFPYEKLASWLVFNTKWIIVMVS